MFTRITNFIRSLRQDPSQNVDRSDLPSVSPPIPEREGIAAVPSSCPEPSTPSGPRRVVYFVPDITQSSHETWKSDDTEFWPDDILNDFHKVTFDYNSSFARSIGTLLSYDSIRMIALRLLIEMHNEIQKMKGQSSRDISLVIIAHGYGGLICEQAYLFSLQAHRQAPQCHGLVRIDGLMLFGTPHFPAGLAQWALISAKKHGITCKDTPQQQDWCEENLDRNLQSIAEMQKEFRDLDSELKLTCYFSLLPVPESKLEISPQWAILPGVKALALNTHHFGMTKCNAPQARQIVELPRRISQEELERRWIKSSQKYHGREEHGEEPSQVTTTTPYVKQDKIFSPMSEEGHKDIGKGKETIQPGRSTMSLLGSIDDPDVPNKNGLERKYGHDIVEQCYRIYGQIHKRGMTNDTTWLEERFDTTPISAILDVVLQAYGGIETLRALFVLRGDQITITSEHIESAVHNRSSGREKLELILLLRGDQVSITGMSDILEAAGANEKDGAAMMRTLLYWYGDRKDLTEEIDRAPAAKRLLVTSPDVATTLFRAIVKRGGNHTEFTRLIAKPSHGDPFGWRMLSWAADQEDDDTFKLLLKSGMVDADFKDFDDGTWTPLHYAIHKEAATEYEERDKVKAKAVVKKLVETSSIDTNDVLANCNNRQALWYAAERGAEEAVKQMLTIKGVDVNSKDKGGETPLFVAARAGHEKVVRALLDTGKVDVNAGTDGETPYSQAKKGRFPSHKEIMRLLRDEDALDHTSGS